MKKTLRVNISGTIFNIDEDAYYKLKKYLDVIETRYSGNEEGMEIFSDIEARVAEHLSDKINSHKTVINQEDIDDIINTMGMPDDFDDTEDDSNENSKKQGDRENKKKRRMYRDTDSKYIAGVASGVSRYFGIDPLIIRALFIISLFFAGTGFFIYLILWIALPEALTPSQKLEMTGKPVTISNIENSLNEEFKNVRENFDKFKESGKYDNLKNGTNSAVKSIGSFIFTILKIALILLGIVLVISAISAIFGLTGGLFFADTIVSISSEGVHTLDHTALIEMFDNSSARYFIYIGLVLTAVLPLIIILFFGLKLIFKFRSNNRIILLSALGLWLIGIVTLTFTAFNISENFQQKAEMVEKHEIDFPKGKTLQILLTDYDLNEVDDILVDLEGLIIYEKDKKRNVLIETEIEIIPSAGNKIIIKLVKTSRGKTKKEAFDNAKAIEFAWEQKDSVLELGRFFKFTDKNRWRQQELRIVIKVPTNEKIFIDETLGAIGLHVKNTEYFWDYEVINRELIMTEEGVSIPTSFKKKKHKKDTSYTNEKEITDDMLEELEEELDND